jgi:environmental stress-induced protein Ves
MWNTAAMIRIQRAAGRPETRWKNGGGVTRELAVSPPGSGFADFGWRISIASVTAGGPFSVFPATDRELVVLEGVLRLSIEGRGEVVVHPGSPSVRFPGDVPCVGEPQAAPVADLNVMTRRGEFSSRTTWIAVARRSSIHARAVRTFVLAVDPVTLIARDLAYELHAHDLAELQPEDRDVALVAHSSRCLLIELTPSGA